MISLKFHRDQARCIEENFLPLMLKFAELKLRETQNSTDDFLNAKILLTLINEVNIIFKRKLLTQAIKFHFKFNDAQAITFYKFLMNHPVPPSQFYLNNLRQHVIDVLHPQFYKPLK